jgi:large conductance mechanosensitive channel
MSAIVGDALKKPLGLLGEFKQFIQRGNVMDLAVGIIMGAAFTSIVNSLVKDVITPPIGYVIGGIDFSNLVITLPEQQVSLPDPANPGQFVTKTLEPAAIKWGSFVQATISFLITAACVFLLVKAFNRFLRSQAAAPPPPAASPQEKLLEEIRDLLKQQIAGGAPTSQPG